MTMFFHNTSLKCCLLIINDINKHKKKLDKCTGSFKVNSISVCVNSNPNEIMPDISLTNLVVI